MQGETFGSVSHNDSRPELPYFPPELADPRTKQSRQGPPLTLRATPEEARMHGLELDGEDLTDATNVRVAERVQTEVNASLGSLATPTAFN